MSYVVSVYADKDKKLWDESVGKVRQSSFLFLRDFMEYHKDRFKDVSLLVKDEKNHIIALLPACESNKDCNVVESHGGLTYGGMLLMPETKAQETDELLSTCIAFYQRAGYKALLYKPLPHIYHNYPAEEDLYWLFRRGAVLESRSISSVIDLRNPYPFSTLRRRKVNKARREGLQVWRGMDCLPAYWRLLDNVLFTRHHVHPVHSLAEMADLMLKFPEYIELYVTLQEGWEPSAVGGGMGSAALLAGCILFRTSRVIHVQYIAASETGREQGALDFLFDQLVNQLQQNAAGVPYLDFGISTEQGGRLLNEGLIFQKEGFGARAVCYDMYRLNFES